MASQHYLTIQSRGTISLPEGVRRRLHVDEPGAQLQLIEREDGVLELHPTLPVPADQRWFWSEGWQVMEREIDAQYEAGQGRMHDSTEAFADYLDSLDDIFRDP